MADASPAPVAAPAAQAPVAPAAVPSTPTAPSPQSQTATTSGATPPPAPISVSEATQPVQPMSVPTPPPSTAVPALQGAINSTQDDFASQLDNAATTAKTGQDSSLEDYINTVLSGPTTGSATETAYSENNVDQLSGDLAATNAQIEAEKESAAHAVTALQANPQGLSTDAINSKIADINRLSASKQADLAVVALAQNGQYTTAKAIADRAVTAAVDAQQQKITALQAIYENNKSEFTTAEQQQFEAAQAERTNQLNVAASNEEARYAEMIKQNDPLNQAQTRSANADAALKEFQAGVEQNGAGAGGFDANGLPITNQDFKNGIPITATGAAASGNPYATQAYALATGLAAPSQYLSARSATTPAGIALTKAANAISLAVNGVPFNPAASEAMFKFRNSSQYQKLTNNAPVAIQTIVQAAQAAQTLGLTSVKALNSLNISTLANGLQFWASPAQKSAAQTLQSFLALNQDDLGLILGSGQGTDYKTELAGLIFDPTGAPKSTSDLTSSIVNKITDKLGQYYTAAGVPNGSAYAKSTAQQLVNSALVGTDAGVNTQSVGDASGATTVQSNGKTYTVGQTYQDASGTQWQVDASGNWTKQ